MDVRARPDRTRPDLAPDRGAQRLTLRRGWLTLGLLLGLAACTATDRPSPADYAALPGWGDAAALGALTPFQTGCAALHDRPPTPATGWNAPPIAAADWARLCTEAGRITSDTAARAWFEANFRPYAMPGDGLLTGYFEPEYPGSLTRHGRYQTPLLARPTDMTSYPTRAAIETGALGTRAKPLVWLASPVDAFFLQIQGSGRIRLEDGHVLRVGFDGRNGHPYVPIGRVLREQGALPANGITMQSIRAWLEAHPDRAQAVMDANPSYVFFRVVTDLSPTQGPRGAMGAPLTAGRSLAVDPRFMPLGLPVFVDAPKVGLRRLMLAQDTGTAITGAARGDAFLDSGAAAGGLAAPARFFLFWPK